MHILRDWLTQLLGKLLGLTFLEHHHLRTFINLASNIQNTPLLKGGVILPREHRETHPTHLAQTKKAPVRTALCSLHTRDLPGNYLCHGHLLSPRLALSDCSHKSLGLRRLQGREDPAHQLLERRSFSHFIKCVLRVAGAKQDRASL